MNLTNHPRIKKLSDWSQGHPVMAILSSLGLAVFFALGAIFRDRAAEWMAKQIDDHGIDLICNWYTFTFVVGILIGFVTGYWLARPASTDQVEAEELTDDKIAAIVKGHLEDVRYEVDLVLTHYRAGVSAGDLQFKIDAKRRELQKYNFEKSLDVLHECGYSPERLRAGLKAIDSFLPYLEEGNLEGARAQFGA